MGDLKKIGALWKPGPTASQKTKLSGVVEVGGEKLRVILCFNDKKRPGTRDPDYTLLSLGPADDKGGSKPKPKQHQSEEWESAQTRDPREWS